MLDKILKIGYITLSFFLKIKVFLNKELNREIFAGKFSP